MQQQGSETFIGLEVSKLHNAVAISDAGRHGEIRYLGEFANTPEATRKLVAKLAAKYDLLHFCYEAGPTGYGLHRCITALGHGCIVIAPTAMPRRPGDRVKTNRRDAMDLARLLRAGELTPVWVAARLAGRTPRPVACAWRGRLEAGRPARHGSLPSSFR